VDIADHDEWMERYGMRIPVLRHAGTDQELDWPFDASTVMNFLKNLT
jgi:hypothetical protein